MKMMPAVVLFVVMLTMVFMYVNAIEQNREIYNLLSTPPTQEEAYLYRHLVPVACSPAGLCIAATYPSYIKFMGFVNPYTAHCASMLCKSFPGINYYDLTMFIYTSETSPNTDMDDILKKMNESETVSINTKAFKDHWSNQKPVHQNPSRSTFDTLLGYTTQFAGIMAAGVMMMP